MNRHRITLLIAALIVAAASLVSSAAVAGDNDPATSDVLDPQLYIPYDGYLMLDSGGLNGARDLQFELYDVSTGGSAVWVEIQTVTFYNGRFNVALGSSTALDSVVLDAEQLYLAIAVDDGTGSFVTLSGRQAIEPVPYAAWSANAADLNVEGSLTVEGDATVNTNAHLLGMAGVGRVAGGANLNIEDPSASRIPLVKAYEFTVDGYDSEGTVNVNMGAEIDPTTGHRFTGTNGAVRQRLISGDLILYTAAPGVTGNAVTWRESVRFRDDNLIDFYGAGTADRIRFRTGGTVGMDIRDSDGDQAYLDFSNDASVDYDARIRLNGDDGLGVLGANFNVSEGRLYIRDETVDTSNNEGCYRIDTTQVCWGTAIEHNDGVTFEKAFNSANRIAISGSCDNTNARWLSYQDLTTTGFTAKVWKNDGSSSNSQCDYIAIGQANTNSGW